MKSVQNLVKFSTFLLVMLILIWLLGPESGSIKLPKEMPVLSDDLQELNRTIIHDENSLNTKPDNSAHIEWYGEPYKKTEYSLVYLHGFGASYMEGDPIHRMIANKYGMNLYLSRLSDHGLNLPPDQRLLHLDAGRLTESALKAIEIGHQIGKKVIVMSCSTGSTLAIYANSLDSSIIAQVMYSPNLDLYDERSQILVMPLGLSIAKVLNGGKIRTWETGKPEVDKYWYTEQRIEAVLPLRKLLNKTMTKDNFDRIKSPIFVGYWYKNDTIQDQTISTKAIREFQNEIETPEDLQDFVAFEDAENHVICSPILNSHWQQVYDETVEFLDGKVFIQ